MNRTLKASDPDAVGVDVNNAGVVDYSYFAQYVSSSNMVHLYVGVNPVNENAAKMSEPDDDRFLNMGNAVAISSGSPIKNDIIPGKAWSTDFAYLAIRHSQTGTGNTFEGEWSEGKSRYMPLAAKHQGEYTLRLGAADL